MLARRQGLLPALGALGLLAALAVARPGLAGAAQGPSKADAAAIRAVIEGQLAAFRHDDGARAFAYAAPEIQRQFGSPEAFMRMVRQGYAPVYRPGQVIFQPLLGQDGAWVQPLVITDEDGRAFVALYQMERQPDGSWRIGGVRLFATKGRGA